MLAGERSSGGARRRARTRRSDYRTRAWQRRAGAVPVRRRRATLSARDANRSRAIRMCARITSEVLYEVGRMEDSMRAARQLVKLDPYFVVGWVRCVRCRRALDRRDDVEESVRRMRSITPDTPSARPDCFDYALAYGRTDEARAALAEIDDTLAKGCGLCANVVAVGARRIRMSIQSNCARRSRTRAEGEAGKYLIARQDIDGYNADIETHGAILERTTSPIFTAANRPGRRCCAIRASRQCWCATASRLTGARKAGPPDAVPRRNRFRMRIGFSERQMR